MSSAQCRSSRATTTGFSAPGAATRITLHSATGSYQSAFEAMGHMLTEVGIRTTTRKWEFGPAWWKFFQAEGKATNGYYWDIANLDFDGGGPRFPEQHAASQGERAPMNGFRQVPPGKSAQVAAWGACCPPALAQPPSSRCRPRPPSAPLGPVASQNAKRTLLAVRHAGNYEEVVRLVENCSD